MKLTTAVIWGALAMVTAPGLAAAQALPAPPILLAPTEPPPSQAPQCSDGIDNDGDGLIDIYNPTGGGCSGNPCTVKSGDTGCATSQDDMESVGIPPGTTLTAYGGSCTISTDGTTIDSKRIDCDLSINANNVTITKSRITGDGIYPIDVRPGKTGLRIEDSEVLGSGGGNYCEKALHFHSTNNAATIRRTWFHDCQDFIAGVPGGVLAEHNLLSNPNTFGDNHADGFEHNGGIGSVYRWNVVLGWYNTAAFPMYGYWEDTENVDLFQNYSESTGRPSVYIYATTEYHANGVRFSHNRFAIGSGQDPIYSPCGSSDRGPTNNVTWSDNRRNDGSVISFHLCSGTSGSQQMACANGKDDDSDGLIDYASDSGCSSASDNNENNAQCGDGIDNDGDGRTDYPADTGCIDSMENSE